MIGSVTLLRASRTLPSLTAQGPILAQPGPMMLAPSPALALAFWGSGLLNSGLVAATSAHHTQALVKRFILICSLSLSYFNICPLQVILLPHSAAKSLSPSLCWLPCRHWVGAVRSSTGHLCYKCYSPNCCGGSPWTHSEWAQLWATQSEVTDGPALSRNLDKRHLEVPSSLNFYIITTSSSSSSSSIIIKINKTWV